jgi:putative salt-induced outer membrane protein
MQNGELDVRNWIWIAALLCLPLPLLAQEEGDEVAASAAAYPEVSGEASLGFISSRGNTKSSSTRVRAESQLDYAVWRHKVGVSGYRTEEGNDTTAFRTAGSLQSDYRITRRSYLFANVNGERDRFGAFERRYSGTLGVGRTFIDTATMNLAFEVGAGRRYERAQGADETNSEAIGRFHGAYSWRFTPQSRFLQDIEVESGSDNTYTESETALRTRLTESLSWTLSYVVQHNSDVPASRERTDTFTTVALDYAY